jgi:hypothetical protein
VIVGLNLLYMLPGLVGGTETYAAALLHGFSSLSACSDTAAIPEIAGDAALFSHPDDVEKMASSIAEISRNEGLRCRLRERGRQRAACFSWEKAAPETMAVYRKVLS